MDENEIIRAIQTKKAIRTDELTSMFNCAHRTLWAKLQDYEYQTSINRNRKYITLDGIPEYQSDGLWECRGAVFSKWGRMKDTIVKLVEESPMGSTPTQLSKRVKATITPQLIELRRKKRLVSRQYGRKHLYLSASRTRQEQQRRAFEDQWKSTKKEPQLSKDIIIQILLTIITHNETEPEKIQKKLKEQQLDVELDDISWLFRKHGIQIKPCGSRSMRS